MSTRVGVRIALEDGGFVVSAEEDTGPGAVAAALRDPPDVCLVEVNVPGGGVEAVAAIRARLAGTRVVMLSASGLAADVLKADQLGTNSYLVKSPDYAQLVLFLQSLNPAA